jgi:hypothetical protein
MLYGTSLLHLHIVSPAWMIKELKHSYHTAGTITQQLNYIASYCALLKSYNSA